MSYLKSIQVVVTKQAKNKYKLKKKTLCFVSFYVTFIFKMNQHYILQIIVNYSICSRIVSLKIYRNENKNSFLFSRVWYYSEKEVWLEQPMYDWDLMSTEEEIWCEHINDDRKLMDNIKKCSHYMSFSNENYTSTHTERDENNIDRCFFFFFFVIVLDAYW